MVKQIVFLVLLGLVAIKTANAVVCYQCVDCNDEDSRKSKNTTCTKDIFDKNEELTTIKTREGGDTTLLPTTTTEGPTDEDYRCLTYTQDAKTHRACSKKTCRVIEGDITFKVTKCEQCEEDYCNPGSIAKSWAISSILLIAAMKFFF